MMQLCVYKLVESAQFGPVKVAGVIYDAGTVYVRAGRNADIIWKQGSASA
jgi:hypothetical protein